MCVRVTCVHARVCGSIFDWDNLFASLLVGVFSKELAYSNVIQSFKAKTAGGYLANCAGGGYKDQDRTEPPVGAKVVLELYRRFGDAWLVELLFDDMLDWNDWFFRQRIGIVPPLELVVLGSYNERSDAPGGMQLARYESGLDNSPMYDCAADEDAGEPCEYFNATTGMMHLYDVGMSSMLAQESYALAELAELVGRREDAATLRARGDGLRELVGAHLWDETRQVFANRFPLNDSLSERISPTSFYAMFSRAPSDNQAAEMVERWLLNPNRFCVAPEGDFEGNSDACHWGLPSISADDPAFPKLGYWRGYVWGPHVVCTPVLAHQKSHLS